MELLVRCLIGFTLIYFAMPLASSKVLIQKGEHGTEINSSEVNYGGLNVTTPQGKLNETSIKHSNDTLTSSSSGFNVNSFDSVTQVPEENQLDARSIPTLPDVKRSLKRIFFAWTFYGPEVGLGSCLFKYAWFNYPIVPEMSHAVMSRASGMVNGLMHDFWEGYAESKNRPSYAHNQPEYSNYNNQDYYDSPEYRISSKVAAMTADDYQDYRTRQVLQNLGPYRRVGSVAPDSQENSPVATKLDPKVAGVVEMLKYLQPKTNASEFVTRFARHLKTQPQLPSNVQRIVSNDGRNVRYFIKNRRVDDGLRSNGNVTRPIIRRKNYNVNPPFKNERLGFDDAGAFGPPDGLPSFSQLPPADYTYFEDGVYHHVHDLRTNKVSHDEGGIDLEDVILQALGLTHARSAPTILKCGTHYVISAVLRFFQKGLLG